MEAKEKALIKLELELKNDINAAISLAREAGLLELLYFVYNLHWIRLLDRFPNAGNSKPSVINAYSNSLVDTSKYIIGIISKYCTWQLKASKNNPPQLNTTLIQKFYKLTNYINAKYETKSLIQLFEVQVHGDRNQYVRIDLSSAETNPDNKKFFNYFLQIDLDNESEKEDKDSLIESFKKEYNFCKDLFLKEMGISVDEYCWLIEELLSMVSSRIMSDQAKFIYLENGNVDVQSFVTFVNFSKSYVFESDKIQKQFAPKFINVIRRLSFEPTNFDERQLRFHYVTRRPLLAHQSLIIISPELLLDSLFMNTHYSLIEAPSIKHTYIARQSEYFLDRVRDVAQKFGYREIGRNKDLFEGRDKIGDIDLILGNYDGKFLLIEGKNHALPMDVYFKDFLKTKEHLNYLQTHWEAKVKRRIEHLKKHHDQYEIPENHQYIVVSRFPEIIAHYTDMTVLSIKEFEQWLNISPQIPFDDFYRQFYEEKMPDFTKEEMEEMAADNLLFGQFAKE